MKITFEADATTELIELVSFFSASADEPCIPLEDQAILDNLLRDQRRLARRVERLDAAYPPPPVSLDL